MPPPPSDAALQAAALSLHAPKAPRPPTRNSGIINNTPTSSPEQHRPAHRCSPSLAAATMAWPMPIDSSSIEVDTPALINMFGGVARKKPTHQAQRKHNTGPGGGGGGRGSGAGTRGGEGKGEEKEKEEGESLKIAVNFYAPQPQHKNPSLAAAKLASQLSPPASGRNSPAPRAPDGLHDAYGIPTIVLPAAIHAGLGKRRPAVASVATTRTRASMEFKPRAASPSCPPHLPAPRKAVANPPPNKSRGADSDSDHDIYTDAPEQPPPPRAVPAPPAPQRNRGPKRRAPGQASASASASKNSTTATPKPPPPRISTSTAPRGSLPTPPQRRTSPPLLPPSRQPTLRTTTTITAIPPTNPKPLSRTRTGSMSILTPQQYPTTTAAVLASSRAQTPLPPTSPAPPHKKTPGPPPPLRRRRSAPTPGLKPTMRRPRPPPPPSSSKETATLNLNLKLNPTHKYKHKHSLSTHPIHISSSTITEKDRKRYEGVWAANRGYLMHTLRAEAGSEVEMVSEGVHPLVVRELWGRSRLGREMLGEMWRLVDRGGKGWLGREEFVVGMWLVDRGLEGRKVPMGGVGEGVWGSVRRLGVMGG